MMRQRAADDHDVVLRSCLAAPLDRPRHLVFTNRHGKVVWTGLDEDPAQAEVHPARGVIDLLEQTDPLLDRPGDPQPVPVLFADDATVRRVIAGLRRAADRDGTDRVRYLSAANRLTLASSLRFSVLRPVLTRVLAHRFYLPTRLGQNRWRDWAQGWSITSKITRSASQLELLHQLCVLGFDRGGEGPVPRSIRNSLLAQETNAWARGSSGKPTATHSAYRAVTAFDAAWHELTLCDPALLERNTLSGDVAVGTVTETTARRTRIALHNTPRFNDANLWAVIDGLRRGVTRDVLLAEGDGSLSMVLDMSPKWRRVFTDARDRGLHVVLYPKRFTMVAATPRSDNPWLNAPQTPWTPRAVPADVLIAGVPNE